MLLNVLQNTSNIKPGRFMNIINASMLPTGNSTDTDFGIFDEFLIYRASNYKTLNISKLDKDLRYYKNIISVDIAANIQTALTLKGTCGIGDIVLNDKKDKVYCTLVYFNTSSSDSNYLICEVDIATGTVKALDQSYTDRAPIILYCKDNILVYINSSGCFKINTENMSAISSNTNGLYLTFNAVSSTIVCQRFCTNNKVYFINPTCNFNENTSIYFIVDLDTLTLTKRNTSLPIQGDIVIINNILFAGSNNGSYRYLFIDKIDTDITTDTQLIKYNYPSVLDNKLNDTFKDILLNLKNFVQIAHYDIKKKYLYIIVSRSTTNNSYTWVPDNLLAKCSIKEDYSLLVEDLIPISSDHESRQTVFPYNMNMLTSNVKGKPIYFDKASGNVGLIL